MSSSDCDSGSATPKCKNNTCSANDTACTTTATSAVNPGDAINECLGNTNNLVECELTNSMNACVACISND